MAQLRRLRVTARWLYPATAVLRPRLDCPIQQVSRIDAALQHRYLIYGNANQKFNRRPSPMEYLNPPERLHYSINQYNCGDLKTLKEKMLQFPADSTFGFTYWFTARDRKEIEEIMAFLRSHGYHVEDPLPPDPPH